MSNKVISFFHFGRTQQIERQIVNNFDLDTEEVKVLLDELRNDFIDRLKMAESDIAESIEEKISRTIECKFIEIICKVNGMLSVTEDRVKQAVRQGFYMLQENSDAFISDLQNQFDEIRDLELSLEENLTNLCNQIAWQSNEAFNSLFEMVAPLKNIKWDFSYELREGWSCLERADFGHAKELFSKATMNQDILAEAYFGLALADCKIQIIWDYKNCRMQPLCYDYSIEFPQNPSYKLALENAVEGQKNEYINFAKEIEHIQKEFEHLESSGLDYDCFICVKIKDNGENTEDSKDADSIYHILQRRGHKPFYSDYEIRNKKGADYEAHILYALYKSKCMLLVCRNKEYLKTPWVKNEYLRFLKMIDDGEKPRDSLVIVFYGKKIERLPGRTGRLEGIDVAERGSDFEIVDFVDRHAQKEMQRPKLTPQPAPLPAPEPVPAPEPAPVSYPAVAPETERKVITYASGDVYDGEVKYDQRNGHGVYRFADGDVYEGEFMDGKANGHGVYRLANGDEYEGEFKDDKFNGHGVYRTADGGVYEGEFKDDKFNGHGVLRSADGDVYEGEFKDDKFNGHGVLRSADGDVFEGEWKDDEFIEQSLIVEQYPKEKKETVNRQGHSPASTYPTPENYDKTEFEIEGTVLKKYKGKASEVKIPFGVTSIGDFAFYGCRSLTSIEIPAGVTSIGKYAFYGCSSLTSIEIPAGVTSIGEYAFDGCSSLTSIVIPDSVTSIGSNTCENCGSLTTIVIPDSVTYIGSGAFLFCSALKSIEIPDSVTSIGSDAFWGCSSLNTVVISDSVTYIGIDAFRGCRLLTIYCEAAEQPSGWSTSWNPDGRPVVWGYKTKS